MPHSHHSHSGQYCKHASGSLEEVIQEAIRQRFRVYGLTEHCPRYRQDDLYPEELDLTLNELAKQFTDYMVEAHRLKSLYAPQITLLVGLETEYITDLDLGQLEGLLAKLGGRVEYIVGSIHHVNGIPIDFDIKTYQKAVASFPSEDQERSQEAFLSAYFDAQYALLQRFKPEIIGHFDLCRLYCPELRFQDYPLVWEKIQRNVQFAVKYGALFEVNAAAFRKKWDSAYPAPDVIMVILSLGGRFALSDDSHGPHVVGLNYHRLPTYLRSVGISELWYLQHSGSGFINAGGRNVQAVRLDGEWSEDVFWHGRSS